MSVFGSRYSRANCLVPKFGIKRELEASLVLSICNFKVTSNETRSYLPILGLKINPVFSIQMPSKKRQTESKV